MAKPNSINLRTDAGFERFCRDLAIKRFQSGKETKIIPPREITRMFMNSNAKGVFEQEALNKDRMKVR